MVGIDLFSGAGGLSLGALYAGVDVKYAIDNDENSTKTYKQNFKNTAILTDDIRNFPKDIPISSNNLVIFGGPPCQGFSTSNQRNRSLENSVNWLFKEFLNIVKLYLPKWFVFENVTGLLNTSKGYFFSEIINSFRLLGYNINYNILNAFDFGVPQIRRRLFIVGCLNKSNFAWPQKTNECVITVDDAISDLPVLPNGANIDDLPYSKKSSSEYAKKLRNNKLSTFNHLVTNHSKLVIQRFTHVPQGGNWKDIPNYLMKNYTNKDRCHTGIYHRLLSNQPSKVIGNFRKNMLIHPYENRGLSVREAARLQSFPDWFYFKGSIGFQQQQVGNAVPPILAKAVFDQIMISEKGR